MGPYRLNMPEIEASLAAVQKRFEHINQTLEAQRDALSDEVRENMLAGYRWVDRHLQHGVDLFALGNSEHLLELNSLVLCGTDQGKRNDYAGHIASTETRFYEKRGGGIRALMEWLQRHERASVWARAAGVYIEILTQPELFIEGNHRTGALIMSYLLAREGEPPFVLSVDNAKAYFDPSSLIKGTKRYGLGSLIRLLVLRRRFAELLKRSGNPRHIIRPCSSSATI